MVLNQSVSLAFVYLYFDVNERAVRKCVALCIETVQLLTVCVSTSIVPPISTFKAGNVDIKP